MRRRLLAIALAASAASPVILGCGQRQAQQPPQTTQAQSRIPASMPDSEQRFLATSTLPPAEKQAIISSQKGSQSSH
jgi:hypothetical protein